MGRLTKGELWSKNKKKNYLNRNNLNKESRY